MVTQNVWSIAEAAFEPQYRPRATNLDGTVIGFLMYRPETDPPDPALFWLFRFMLAPACQTWRDRGERMPIPSLPRPRPKPARNRHAKRL